MKYILLISFALMVSACSQRVFTTPVTASTRASALPEHQEVGKVEVRTCDRFVFFLPMVQDFKKTYQTAFDEAATMGGNAIKDLQVRPDGFFMLMPLFMQNCWLTTGTAIKTAAGSSFSGEGSAWDKPPEASGEPAPTEGKSRWDTP